MGEAKKRRIATVNKNSSAGWLDVDRRFSALKIDRTLPGFYDHPNFVKEEQKDQRFAEAYADWVLLRERDAAYESKVREVVPKLAEIIEARIVRHNWQGACIAITAIVTRALDRLGIWNVPMKGSASAYSGSSSRHFTIIDDNEGAGFETGHMWIIAPPYDVIDLTLHHQRWRGDAFQKQIPKKILGEGLASVKARVEDIVAPEVRARHSNIPDLHNAMFPDQARVLRKFPAKAFVIGTTDIRYVPASVSLPDVPLELVNAQARAGVPAIEIWREDIAPAFGIAIDG